MTYFGFLLRFLGPPILLLILFLWRDRHQSWPSNLSNFSIWIVLLLHVFIAVSYTTLWDNYLVATQVWWYDPKLVTGLTLGYVPIEEYIFFILQTLFTGLWLFWLMRRIPRSTTWRPSYKIRIAAMAIVLMLWLTMLFMFIIGPVSWTYIALILLWAFPPIALQLAFGADILWRYRKLVAAAIFAPTIYLWTADALAIAAGTWTINPNKTLRILLPGGLPIEEAVFFWVTNILIVFGITLSLAEESHPCLRRWLPTYAKRLLTHEP